MKKEKLLKIILLFIIGGIFGFIYETLFYRIDLGYFTKRGTTFGPWIPIYAYGALLINTLTKKSNNNFKTFIISGISCGLLELFIGFITFKIFNVRLWDYNIEILNFGNIGGFVCLRSVLFFGVSGIFLKEIINPLINNITNNINKTKSIIIYSVGLIFILDVIINCILFLIR